MTRNDWPYLSEWTDKRSGKIFRRVRKAGRVAYLPADCPKSDKRFTDAYHAAIRSEEHTSELQSHSDLVCRLLLEKKNNHSSLSYCLCPFHFLVLD